MSWLYSNQLDTIENKLDNILSLLTNLTSITTKGQKQMAVDFSQLAAAVTAETTVEASAETLLTQLNQAVSTLQQEVANAPDMTSVQNQINAFAASLNGNVTTLQNAITQNTTTLSNTVVANTTANVATNTVVNPTSN